MLNFKFKIVTLVLGMVFAFFSFTALADDPADTTTTTTVVEKHTIITPAPKAVCTAVAGHWEGSVWVDTHNVCRYENRSEGAAWVDTYWSCTVYDANGNCTSWALVPGHWEKTIE